MAEDVMTVGASRRRVYLVGLIRCFVVGLECSQQPLQVTRMDDARLTANLRVTRWNCHGRKPAVS